MLRAQVVLSGIYGVPTRLRGAYRQRSAAQHGSLGQARDRSPPRPPPRLVDRWAGKCSGPLPSPLRARASNTSAHKLLKLSLRYAFVPLLSLPVSVVTTTAGRTRLAPSWCIAYYKIIESRNQSMMVGLQEHEHEAASLRVANAKLELECQSRILGSAVRFHCVLCVWGTTVGDDSNDELQARIIIMKDLIGHSSIPHC